MKNKILAVAVCACLLVTAVSSYAFGLGEKSPAKAAYSNYEAMLLIY